MQFVELGKMNLLGKIERKEDCEEEEGEERRQDGREGGVEEGEKGV